MHGPFPHQIRPQDSKQERGTAQIIKCQRVRISQDRAEKSRSIMDSSSKAEYQNFEDALLQERGLYKVSYSHVRNTKERFGSFTSPPADDTVKEPSQKRNPVGRIGNNPGRVKRVVSCKRKTHYLTVAWKNKQPAPARSSELANKENHVSCVQDWIFPMEPWDFPPVIHAEHDTATGSTPEPTDYLPGMDKLVSDHSTMIDVLSGRSLRLKVATTLWKRNAGELLTYFLRVQDTAAFVDFLPVITKSLNEDSPALTIGYCVDLFPLVKDVLSHPYEEYHTVGLIWIRTVLKNWWEELRASGHSGLPDHSLDKNFSVFNKLLLELWQEEPSLKSVPGIAGNMAQVIDSFLLQLI